MAEALSNEDPSLLVVVLDGSELYWKYRHENCFEGQLNYNEVVSNLILFCNAYALMHRLNRLAVLLCRDEEVIQIYPRRSFSDNSSNDDYNSKHGESSNMIVTNGGVGENIIFSHQQDPFIPISHSLPAILAQGLLKEGIITTMAPDIMDNGDNTANITLPPSSENKRSSIANGISKALCIINRQIIITSSKYRYQPRICLFQLGKDNALAYNNIMNSIFSADKLNTPIDAFLLSSDDSHFMQQASFLTHGIYMRPADQTDMLQVSALCSLLSFL